MVLELHSVLVSGNPGSGATLLGRASVPASSLALDAPGEALPIPDVQLAGADKPMSATIEVGLGVDACLVPRMGHAVVS